MAVVCEGDVCRYVPQSDAPEITTAFSGHPILSMLGPTLMGSGGSTVQTESLLGRGKFVGLYFSGHWCPPCRGFTPKLKEFYTSHNAAHGDTLDIVFVSSDRDESGCREYHAGMPWKLLPYALRDKKNALNKQFKVTSIPTLVLLDAHTGELVCRDGRNKVVSDPAGAGFPWRPPSLAERLQGPVVDAAGAKSDFAAVSQGKVVGLYFSAHWCPPCRAFTPLLAAFYKARKQAHGDFEIVFVSSDRSEADFQEYLAAEMPWWAYSFEHATRAQLGQAFDVEGIPTLVLLGVDGRVITSAAADALREDPTGAGFPFAPRPVERLSQAVIGKLNKEVCCVYFARDDSAESVAAAEDVLMESALQEFGKEVPAVYFFVADGRNPIAQQIMRLLGLSANAFPSLVAMELPAFAVLEAAPTTSSGVDDFIKRFVTKDPSLNIQGLE